MDLHVLEENSAPLKKGAEVQRERIQHAGFISKKRPVQCASCPLPRTILAVTVGSALAVADALMQGHTRNPLADPGLLSISAGAALAVVIGFTWCGFTSVTATGVMALIGALIAAAIVFVAANVVGGEIRSADVNIGRRRAQCGVRLHHHGNHLHQHHQPGSHAHVDKNNYFSS